MDTERLLTAITTVTPAGAGAFLIFRATVALEGATAIRVTAIGLALIASGVASAVARVQSEDRHRRAHDDLQAQVNQLKGDLDRLVLRRDLAGITPSGPLPGKRHLSGLP